MASVTAAAPPAKASSSLPCSTRPGCGSEATRRVNSATGSSPSAATRITLPKRRPRSTAGSAARHACGKHARTVAICARRNSSRPPSATLAA